ncbi:MAG: hypothetical protein ACR2OO_16660 [Thermomicrobiales bacterium]
MPTSDALSNPKMTAAITELTEIIRGRYPDTIFTTEIGEDRQTVFVTAIVDVDDPDEVVDCFIDRAVTLQVDEGLPLHVIPIRTPARREKLRAALQAGRPSSGTTGVAAG